MVDDSPARASESPPLLKYVRLLGGARAEALRTDAVTACAAHATLIVLGTRSGALHVLDASGRELHVSQPHSATVTDISIDARAEHVGSCSHDGTVVVRSLASNESSTRWYHRPVLAVELEREYAARSRTVATGGLAGDFVLSLRGWLGSKDVVVHSGEGPVRAIACAAGSGLYAWANDAGVKVFDAARSRRVSYIERPSSVIPAERLRPHLRWEGAAELLIGWGDCIKIGKLLTREASSGVGGSSYYVEITAVLQTDFYVCGLCGMSLRQDERGEWQRDLLVLAYAREPHDEEERPHVAGVGARGEAARPELRLLSRNNVEQHSDALSMLDFESLEANDYRLVVAPTAAAVVEGKMARLTLEEAPTDDDGAAGSVAELTLGARLPQVEMYIISPYDIVVARSLDLDDHISWLIQRDRCAEALELARAHEHQLVRHSLADVVAIRVTQQLAAGEAASAACECARSLGTDETRWLAAVREFDAANSLPALAQSFPAEPPLLPHAIYDEAAVRLATCDAAALLAGMRQWPQGTYRPRVVAEAVAKSLRIAQQSKDTGAAAALIETLAIAEGHAGNHAASLDLLLQLAPGSADVFGLIERQRLYGFLRPHVGRLAEISWPMTLELLLAHAEALQPTIVMPQLQASLGSGSEAKLLEYLEQLIERDPDAAAGYHNLVLQLLAELAPERLLSFLKVSSHYSLVVALDVAESHGLVDSQIFLQTRVGANDRALALLLDAVDSGASGDTSSAARAIEFVDSAGEAELWGLLLQRASSSAPLLGQLLERAGREPALSVQTSQIARALLDGAPVDDVMQHLERLLTRNADHLATASSCVDAARAEWAAVVRESHSVRIAGACVDIASLPSEQPAAETTDRSSTGMLGLPSALGMAAASIVSGWPRS